MDPNSEEEKQTSFIRIRVRFSPFSQSVCINLNGLERRVHTCDKGSVYFAITKNLCDNDTDCIFIVKISQS